MGTLWAPGLRGPADANTTFYYHGSDWPRGTTLSRWAIAWFIQPRRSFEVAKTSTKPHFPDGRLQFRFLFPADGINIFDVVGRRHQGMAKKCLHYHRTERRRTRVVGTAISSVQVWFGEPVGA